MQITPAPTGRITRDAVTGAVRTWFDPRPQLPAKPQGMGAGQFAREILTDNAGEFNWANLNEVADREVLEGPGGTSVRFEQRWQKLRVDESEVVVNLDGGGRPSAIYNGFHYDIPTTLDMSSVRIQQAEAVRIAEALLGDVRERVLHSVELIVYRYRPANHGTGKPTAGPADRARVLAAASGQISAAADAGFRAVAGTHYIAWDVRIFTPANLPGSWRVLIDAASGRLLNVMDQTQYANGTVQVFDPNPIVTSGDITLRHTSPAATINAQRITAAVDNLDAPSGGVSVLHGTLVQMEEKEAPIVAEPTSGTATFEFSWDSNSFLDAMAYFHLNRFQEYVQGQLGISNAANYSIPIDPQGYSGDDNSHYVSLGSGKGYIAFGGGLQPIPPANPVPDAADAMVVLHEYGHAIQDNSNPGFDNPSSGIGEGWGDTLAAIYYDDKHANPAATRGYMMSWDSEMGTGSWGGRRYDVTWLFDGPEYTGYVAASDNHSAGQLWCATMFELYRKLGGDSAYSDVKAAARDLAFRLHLTANFNVPTTDGTAQQMGQQVEAADRNLGGWRYIDGLHGKVIYDTFRRRHLSTYADLGVDVYIDDGRQGGYGSLSGNDLFSETLWVDGWWETQDIWVRETPYANDAAQQAGTPADHVEPAVGTTAYMYVRVGNKGTSMGGSGVVTVKGFHADPGIGLTWPIDWIPMDTPSINANNVQPGVANHVVVGPFPWTPTVVGHECVLAVVECANDPAVTQNFTHATDQAQDGDMVPYDNNIAQRNLAPVSAKRGGKRRFVVQNPTNRAGLMELRVDNGLPRGWRAALGELRFELKPRERRWVEIDIEPAAGGAAASFDKPHILRISGSMGNRALGGMSFYLAPESAVAKGS